MTLRSILEVFDRWVSLDAKLPCQLLLDGSINFSELDLSFELSGCGVPLWLEGLAVTAPWGIELHHPDVFGGEHSLLEVCISQDNDILVSGGTRG